MMKKPQGGGGEKGEKERRRGLIRSPVDERGAFRYERGGGEREKSLLISPLAGAALCFFPYEGPFLEN